MTSKYNCRAAIRFFLTLSCCLAVSVESQTFAATAINSTTAQTTATFATTTPAASAAPRQASLPTALPEQQLLQQQPTSTRLSSASAAALRHLTPQSAPYAIESAKIGVQSAPNQTRNILFKLNPTNSDGSFVTDKEPWATISQTNSSLSGTRVNFNLKRLLETLESNNFTSEVKFDNNDGSVNITISNYRDNAILSSVAKGANGNSLDRNGTLVAATIDELLLEELLLDAKWAPNFNGSSVLKDNHRYEARTPVRSKPASLLAGDVAIITPPPIRSAMEVVAENYTVKKIADEANGFAIKLLHQLNIEKLGSRNIIQAPFAIYQGLALLLSGAAGDTAKELDKALLGSQSHYENQKLTHDQDRSRLLASLGDVIRQLQYSATHHLRSLANDTSVDRPINPALNPMFHGGTSDQHLIVANNLLFSPSAYEISNEFKNSINSYYNNTVLSKMEIGSTESIRVVNAWIRRTTGGVIPSVFNTKSTFDEFNVMALLSTSWLSQEWKDTFYKVSSPLRSNIRLKAPRKIDTQLNFHNFQRNDDVGSLLEFVDDNKQSHFVEYMKSQPSKSIHHYHSIISGLVVDVVAVPFRDSNHRLITLTPIATSAANQTQQQFSDAMQSINGGPVMNLPSSGTSQTNSNSNNNSNSTNESPDSSLLSKLIASLASNPRKAMRTIWNVIAPDLITKQTLQTIHLARQKNVTIDTIETSIIPLVQLSVPLIRTEADSSVSAALNHIGIVSSFDPDQANFIGINGHPFNYYKLHLSNVMSKTTFNLNERGINYDKTIKTLEALRILPAKQKHLQQQQSQTQQDRPELVEPDDDYIKLELVDEVKLNKPFMYLICDIKTRLILYTGVVRSPMQEGP